MSVVLERDEVVLQKAGVTIGDLTAAAADYVRHQPLYRVKIVTSALTQSEQDFLRRAGASGVGEDYNSRSYQDTLNKSAVEYANMVGSSWTQARVAEFLGVSTGRIRQKTDNKTLYSIKTQKGRVYPKWQFAEEGGTVPGIEEVLPLINEDAHPIGIQGFFLTPQCDLEDEVNGEVVEFSPISWLLTGHSVEDVKKLAEYI